MPFLINEACTVPADRGGSGEIGITGKPAAVANAIYNARGKRVRDLPITLEKPLSSDDQ